MRRGDLQYEKAADYACNQPKDWVDTYASNAAAVLRLEPGGDLHQLVEKLGGRIQYRDLFDAEADADTIFVHGPRDFDIILSTASSPARDRFTIAHELGHYFLHSESGRRPLVAARSGSDRAEWEANWFAAGLLMPKDAFQKAFNDGKKSSFELAAMFAVSQQAAVIRMKVLELSR